MHPKIWRDRYGHIPRDFPRRIRVLQELWGMNAVDFGWALGLSYKYVHRWRQATGFPTIEHVSKMEYAAGLPAVSYLMAAPGCKAPVKPKENTGEKGPGEFEKLWKAKRVKKRWVQLPGGGYGYPK